MKLGKRMAAVAASGTLIGLFGLNLAGGVAANAACPDHSGYTAQDPQPPWSQPVAGPWVAYASGDPTAGAPSGTNGYVGVKGNIPVNGLDDGYIEAGGDATDPAGTGYAVIGGHDDAVALVGTC